MHGPGGVHTGGGLIMTLYQFRLLSDNDQIDLLYKEGIYVGKQKIVDGCIVLYQLDSFYIEVVYRKYRCFVMQLRCFRSTSLLDPYLQHMNVNYLMDAKF